MMCTIIITFIGSIAGAGWIFLSGRPVIRWGSLSAILMAVAISIYFLAEP